MLAADQCFVFVGRIDNEPQEELFSGEEELEMLGTRSSEPENDTFIRPALGRENAAPQSRGSGWSNTPIG